MSSAIKLFSISVVLLVLIALVLQVARLAPLMNPPPPPLLFQAPTSEDAFSPPIDGAVIAGKVVYRDPSANYTDFSSIHCLDDRIVAFSNDIVVTHGGALANVLIYIKEGLPDTELNKSAASSINRPTLTFTTLEYYPHVLAVQVGQGIELHTTDESRRHIWTYSSVANADVDFPSPFPWGATIVTFPRSEIPIRISNKSFPWMSCYICVIDHPYFNVTNSAGLFRLSGVPPGTYVVESWHETLGTKQCRVTVTENALSRIKFEY